MVRKKFFDSDAGEDERKVVYANTYISAHVENNVVVFTISSLGWFTFLGTSSRSSSQPLDTSNSLTVSVPPKENAIIIFKITIKQDKKDGGGLTDCLFVIPMTWKGDKLIVDLDRPFIPPSDRLLLVSTLPTGEQCVVVQTDEHRYIWSELEERETLLEQNYRVVDDPNLLCRFVLNLVTLEDIEASATPDGRSTLERELAQKNSALEGELKRAQTRIAETEQAYGDIVTTITQIESELETMRLLKKENSRITAIIAERDRNLRYYRDLFNDIQGILENSGPHETLAGFLLSVKIGKIKRILFPAKIQLS